MTLSRAQAKQLTAKIFSFSSVADVRVRVEARRTGNARFAASQPTTSGDVEEFEVHVTAVRDGRSATASGSGVSEAQIQQIVKRAEALVEVAPVDPELVAPLGPQKLPNVGGFDRKLAEWGPGQRVPIVESSIEAGRSAGVSVAGFLEHRDETHVVADKAGLFAHHRATRLSFSTTCRTRDGTGSNKRGYLSHSPAGFEAGRLVGDAAGWAMRARAPHDVKPGRYTVVLAPAAVAELLAFMLEAMDHRDAVEGRSFFAKAGGGTRLGETLFDPRVRLFSDPAQPLYPARPFADDGRPMPKVTWVEGGVLKALTASRYWAKKVAADPLPEPTSLHMEGTDQTIQQLISGVKSGIFVTRFWYSRMLEPQSILATGLTRDGTFTIHDGQIVGPIKNLRYNESPVTMLRRIKAIGRTERVGLARDRVMVLPPIVVEGFNFESVSDAV
jgi:predicted Zn-dependent protease